MKPKFFSLIDVSQEKPEKEIVLKEVDYKKIGKDFDKFLNDK